MESAKPLKEYNPDGIPIIFDLQIEAEILGCKLQWAPHNPPAVISHPLAEGKLLKDLKIPEENEGRVGVALEAHKTTSNEISRYCFVRINYRPFYAGTSLNGHRYFRETV
jgi:uroporphyrinogen-III decarboxylase